MRRYTSAKVVDSVPSEVRILKKVPRGTYKITAACSNKWWPVLYCMDSGVLLAVFGTSSAFIQL
jgi:hypothetical protein